MQISLAAARDIVLGAIESPGTRKAQAPPNAGLVVFCQEPASEVSEDEIALRIGEAPAHIGKSDTIEQDRIRAVNDLRNAAHVD